MSTLSSSILVSEFSQLNTSCSKMRFTFSKDARFKDDLAKSSSHKFYELPSVRNTRAAGIGYGTKCALAEERNNSPSPQRYNINSLFQGSKTKKKGYVFGESRDNVKGSGIPKDQNVPGPGKYSAHTAFSKICYSIRARPNLPTIGSTPGPGTYELLTGIDKVGVYPLAKMKNSCCSLINPEPTEKKIKNPGPGPGYYDNNKVGIANNGSILVSQCSNSRSHHFGHQQRKFFDAFSLAPGPGSYTQTSDFGLLEKPKMCSYRKSEH